MDYQPAIIDRMGNQDELLSKMTKTINLARDNKFHIGYVRVAFTDNDYKSLPETNKTFKTLAENKQMSDADPSTAIHEKLAPNDSDIIVRKTRVGAFSTTDLHTRLREKGIDTLILAGISTSGVVLSTIRDAADHDYRIFVLSDCCFDPDLVVHEVLMKKVFPRQATVIDSSSFERVLRKEMK
jgi:nicotinamidase-related amidase